MVGIIEEVLQILKLQGQQYDWNESEPRFLGLKGQQRKSFIILYYQM